MRCHLNVKQPELRPHAAIRYEVTDGVRAGQKWMAGEGTGAGTLVAQGPVFCFADSYLSSGRSKSGISKVDLPPTVLYSVSSAYAAAPFLRLPDLPPSSPPPPPSFPPSPPSYEDRSPPEPPALHFHPMDPLTAVPIINTDIKQIGRRDTTQDVSFCISRMWFQPGREREKKNENVSIKSLVC